MTQWPNAQRPMTNDQVRIFLAGGVALTDVTMLDKDDTVYLAWRGEAWREPGSKPASEIAAKEPAAVAAEGIHQIWCPLQLIACRKIGNSRQQYVNQLLKTSNLIHSHARTNRY